MTGQGITISYVVCTNNANKCTENAKLLKVIFPPMKPITSGVEGRDGPWLHQVAEPLLDGDAAVDIVRLRHQPYTRTYSYSDPVLPSTTLGSCTYH